MVVINSDSLSAIVSTFSSTDATITNIKNIASQVSSVVVIDDSGNQQNNHFVEQQLAQINNVSVICNAVNIGLAGSLNLAINHSIANGAQWVIVFDDDTVLAEHAMDRLINAVNNQLAISTNLSDSVYAFCRSGHYRPDLAKNTLVERNVVITSGSLFPTTLFKQLNGFDADFFIDLLDFDFCLRTRANGGSVYQLNNIDIRHTVGTPENVNLGMATVTTSNHAPFRYYYHYRNSILFARKHLVSQPVFVLKMQIGLLIKLIKIILFESRRLVKIRYIGFGILHGFGRRYGKIPEKLMRS